MAKAEKLLRIRITNGSADFMLHVRITNDHWIQVCLAEPFISQAPVDESEQTRAASGQQSLRPVGVGLRLSDGPVGDSKLGAVAERR